MSRSADASEVTSLKQGEVASAWLTASAQPSAQMGSDAIESKDRVIFVTSRIAASSGLHASKTRFASSSASRHVEIAHEAFAIRAMSSTIGATKTDRLRWVGSERSRSHSSLSGCTASLNAPMASWKRSGMSRGIGAGWRQGSALSASMDAKQRALHAPTAAQLSPSLMQSNATYAILCASAKAQSASRHAKSTHCAAGAPNVPARKAVGPQLECWAASSTSTHVAGQCSENSFARSAAAFVSERNAGRREPRPSGERSKSEAFIDALTAPSCLRRVQCL